MLKNKEEVNMTKSKISVRQYVSVDRISDLLCNALEGGSNYWYMITSQIDPKEWTYYGSFNEDKTKYLHLYPFNEWGTLLINDERADDPELKRPVALNLKRIKRGLAIMAKEHPSEYADFITDKDDASTADVFLQCCIFGKVIYG